MVLCHLDHLLPSIHLRLGYSIQHFMLLNILEKFDSFLWRNSSLFTRSQVSYIRRNNMKFMPQILYKNSPKALPIRTYLCNVKQIIKTIASKQLVV